MIVLHTIPSDALVPCIASASAETKDKQFLAILVCWLLKIFTFLLWEWYQTSANACIHTFRVQGVNWYKLDNQIIMGHCDTFNKMISRDYLEGCTYV